MAYLSDKLTQFHRAVDGSVRWRITTEGVEIEGGGVERTPGQPKTLTRIWEAFHDPINEFCVLYHVPAELIVATIATESSGNPNAQRLDPGYVSDEATPGRVSLGLMQTLISTARDSLTKRGHNPTEIDRAWLLHPQNAIQAGVSYIQQQSVTTGFDPVLVAAAYNAGGIYPEKGDANRFKIRQYPLGTSQHCDRFIGWFNDFRAIAETHPVHPAESFS